MHALVLFACLAATAAPAFAAGGIKLQGPVPADVVDVIDGDTIRVTAHIWINTDLTIDVRMRGIDAPELHGRCDAEIAAALRAKDRLTEMLQTGSVELTDIGFDKYGNRVLATVLSGGANTSGAMLHEGLARPYHGQARQTWCGG